MNADGLISEGFREEFGLEKLINDLDRGRRKFQFQVKMMIKPQVE
jgi:hypothetical protein